MLLLYLSLANVLQDFTFITITTSKLKLASIILKVYWQFILKWQMIIASIRKWKIMTSEQT